MTPKLEPPTLDVKEEMGEAEANEQVPDALNEVQKDKETQPFDSEDSLSQERVVDEHRRLTKKQPLATSEAPHQNLEVQPLLKTDKEPQLQENLQEDSGSYAPQRSER